MPVVLLHGLTATRRYVVMGSRALERSGHRVVAYDARGHGRSGPAPDPSAYTYPELSADLLAVLDDRGIRRAVLAGASMGAHTIVRFALDHGDRVAGIVLATPAYTPEGEHSDLERWDALSEGLRARRGGGVRRGLRRSGRARALARHGGSRPAPAPGRPRSPRRGGRRPARRAALGSLRGLGGAARARAPRGGGAEPRRGRPGPSVLRRRALCRRDPGRRAALAEEPGESPLAWQGAQLSKVIAELAARADAPS